MTMKTQTQLEIIVFLTTQKIGCKKWLCFNFLLEDWGGRKSFSKFNFVYLRPPWWSEFEFPTTIQKWSEIPNTKLGGGLWEVSAFWIFLNWSSLVVENTFIYISPLHISDQFSDHSSPCFFFKTPFYWFFHFCRWFFT